MTIRSFFADSLRQLLAGLDPQRDRVESALFIADSLTDEQVESAYRGNWIARKLITIPAEDSTRMWRNWHAEKDEIEQLEETEKKFNVRAKTKDALIKARLYGGALMVIGTDEDMSLPMDVERIRQDSLKWIHVVPRPAVSNGEVIQDITSPWYGFPEYYESRIIDPKKRALLSNTHIHPSRVVRFLGNELPNPMNGMNPGNWGESILTSVHRAVKEAQLTSSALAQLIGEANIDVLTWPGITETLTTPEGTKDTNTVMSSMADMKSVWRMMLLDKDMTWQRLTLNFAGMPDVLNAFLLMVCAAGDIPATRMLGKSPEGLNATGESDVRNYYDSIRSDQEMRITPAMNQLDEVLIRTTLGDKPEEIWYDWAPLWQLDETQKATNFKTMADGIKVIVDSGTVQIAALAGSYQNALIEGGMLPGLEQELADAEARGELVEEPDPLEEAKVEGQVMKLQGTHPEQLAKLAPKPAQKLLPKPKKDGFGKRARQFKDRMTRPLYVYRDLVNTAEFNAWAKKQGFEDLVPDLHVTILYSREPVDWFSMGGDYSMGGDDKGQVVVSPGGPRSVENLGAEGAVVLHFASSQLSWRHEDMVRSGASHDYDEYQCHVTITYNGRGVDLEEVEPYRGRLVFGPEIFKEIA